MFEPAIREPRGLPRLAALFERWVRRVSVEIDSGCIYISGAVEFDDRPGPVRDALAEMVRAWHAALERAIRIAIEEGAPRAPTPTRTSCCSRSTGSCWRCTTTRASCAFPARSIVRALAFMRMVRQCATPAGLASIEPPKARKPRR